MITCPPWPEGFVPQFWPQRRRPESFIMPERSMKETIALIAKAYDFTYEDLVGPRRHKSLARARFAAMDACRKTGFWSLLQIGKAMNRDHTTVLSGLRRHQELLRKGAV